MQLPVASFSNLPDGANWRVYAIRSEAPDRRLLSALGKRIGSQRMMHVRYADELIVANQLGPVLEYDRRRGTDLTITLDAYFRANRSVNQTAHDLRIHPNTVIQRLARIDSLIGPGWREAASLDVQFSLLIHTVVGDLDIA